MKYAVIVSSTIALGLCVTAATAQETALSIDDAIAIALDAQPGTIVEAEVDQFEGRAVADIEVVNEAGEEIEFKIDLASREILNVWTDDDPTDDPAAVILEDATFLVPGHPGGGWDTLTRTMGQALGAVGITDDLAIENKDGNNGGVGLSHMIENADALSNTVMLNTTQIVVRSLNGTYSDCYADLIPVAAPVGDYAAFIVHPDSEIQSMTDLMNAYQQDPAGFAIGGGSAPQGIDHLVSAMVMQGAQEDTGFSYVQFDAPEPAFAAMIAGDVRALTTEYTQAAALAEQGAVRIIGVTSPEGFALPEGAANMTMQGIDMEFIAWAGFFATPGTSQDEVEKFETAFAALYETETWEELVSENGWIRHQLDAQEFAALLETQGADVGAALAAIAAN